MNTNFKDFVDPIKEYLSLIDNHTDFTPRVLLSKCAILLPEIYTIGIQLPDLVPTDDDNVYHDFESPMRELGTFLGKYDFYSEIFDPFQGEKMVVSSIADDLADIYRDLKEPLLEFENGKENNAIWTWKFNIQGHCGDHIVDVMRIIHRLIHSQMPSGNDSSNEK